MNDIKIRQFEVVQQVDYYNIETALKWLKKIDCIFLAVLHDKDETEPHYHIFVKMNGARAISDIANQLEIKENYINYIKKWKNALAYAFHLTETSKNEKYKYDSSAVVDFRNIDIEEIFNINQEYENNKNVVLETIYKYGKCEISKKNMLAIIDERDYLKYYNVIKRMNEYRNLTIKERKMQVLYICGASGTGKTTLAKFLADTKKYDPFISGSGSDILDGYDKEECIILDDLRGDVFKKSELFKLLDNNTNSSVKSRFHNKDISNCKLLIITSILAPALLYNWDETKDQETANQLARRLNYEYIKIDERGLLYSVKIDDHLNTGDITPYTELNMSIVFSALQIFQSSPTIKSIFDEVTKEARKKIEENGKLPF